MHRISLALADACLYKEQKVQLAGLNIRARIGGVWVAGKQVCLTYAITLPCSNLTVFRFIAQVCSVRQQYKNRLSLGKCKILYIHSAFQGNVDVR